MLRQAVILAGELDGRPEDRNATAPRSMLNVGGRPFLDILIDEIARYDVFDEILLLAGDQPEDLLARYTGMAKGRTRLTVAPKREPGGTAGALVHAADLLRDRFLLLNGDSFFDFNLLDLMSRSGSGPVHMALRADVIDDKASRAVLDNNRVLAFVAPGNGTAGSVSAGICVVDRSIVASVSTLPASFEQDVLPLLAQGGAVNGTCYEGYFIDIGATEDLVGAGVELSERLRRPAVFFDRDGVLNHDSGYLFEASKLKWIDGAREAIKAVNDAGYFAFVVTNQSGVARGLYEERDVQALHRWMADDMATMGAHVDAFEYCPDHPDGAIEQYRRASHRRKPAPGMITDLLNRYPVNADRSILIGDRPDDLEAARAAGLQGYLFSGGNLAAFVKQHLRPRHGNTPKPG